MFYFLRYVTFFLYSSFLFGQSMDSLENELALAKKDTSKISILIELTYSTDSLEAQLKYARQAYEIGLNVTSIKHKSRSEIILGLTYSEYELDSGAALIEKGAKRYLANKLFDYAANAYYLKGITYEAENAFDSAVASYTTSYELSNEYDVHPEKGNSASALANISNLRGHNVEALKWALEAKTSYEESDDLYNMSQALNQIGIIYDQKGLYSEALDSYLKARDIAIENEDIDAEILISNNIGIIYNNMNNLEMALSYYNDALEKTKIHGIDESEATLLNNLSYIYLKTGDTLRAQQLLKQSLNIDLSNTYPCFESYPLEGLGSIFLSKNKLDSAELLLKKALSTAQKCEDVAVSASVYKDLGLLYSKKGLKFQAKKSLEDALRISQNSELLAEKRETLNELYIYHKNQGEKKIAMEYLEMYSSLSDSMHRASSIEKAAELGAQYEFRKQVAQMEQERLESEKLFIDEIKAKSKENRLILLVLALFILLAVSLMRSIILIRKQNKKLKWLNEEKNKLMGMVAHDLRNPLNMIIGLMPLFEDLSSAKKDKDLQKYVELLGISSERMRNMIDRVLDLSEIENMKINLKMEKTDLSKLTYQSIHNFDIIASQKEITIVDNIDKSIPRYSNVDPSYLVQVIDNLLSNAIKFSTREKQIEVHLKTEGEKHIMSVQDEGPGISKEEQKNLFQAYKTLSSKPTGQERSTGLGLSIAQKFVMAMGGEIECISNPGEGATFNLIFHST